LSDNNQYYGKMYHTLYCTMKNRSKSIPLSHIIEYLFCLRFTCFEYVPGTFQYEENFYPKATKFKGRCLTCTYRNICIKWFSGCKKINYMDKTGYKELSISDKDFRKKLFIT